MVESPPCKRTKHGDPLRQPQSDAVLVAAVQDQALNGCFSTKAAVSAPAAVTAQLALPTSQQTLEGSRQAAHQQRLSALLQCDSAAGVDPKHLDWLFERSASPETASNPQCPQDTGAALGGMGSSSLQWELPPPPPGGPPKKLCFHWSRSCPQAELVPNNKRSTQTAVSEAWRRGGSAGLRRLLDKTGGSVHADRLDSITFTTNHSQPPTADHQPLTSITTACEGAVVVWRKPASCLQLGSEGPHPSPLGIDQGGSQQEVGGLVAAGTTTLPVVPPPLRGRPRCRPRGRTGPAAGTRGPIVPPRMRGWPRGRTGAGTPVPVAPPPPRGGPKSGPAGGIPVPITLSQSTGRPRGRPRKKPAAGNPGLPVALPPSTGRPRGRPRKTPIATSAPPPQPSPAAAAGVAASSAHPSAQPSVDCTVPAVGPPPPTGRPRGRPRKTPIITSAMLPQPSLAAATGVAASSAHPSVQPSVGPAVGVTGQADTTYPGGLASALTAVGDPAAGVPRQQAVASDPGGVVALAALAAARAAAEASYEGDHVTLDLLLRTAAEMVGTDADKPLLLRAVAEWLDRWDRRWEPVYCWHGKPVGPTLDANRLEPHLSS